MSDALDREFEEAVDCVNNHTEPFPADTLLQLYAYYKRANHDWGRPSGRKPLINAFKTNALFQTRDMSQDEAKQEYVDLVKRYFESLEDC